MRIKNETDWETADLRAVFAKVLTRWNQIDDRKVPSKRLKHITVVDSRRGFLSGHARYNSGTMRLRLPKPTRRAISAVQTGPTTWVPGPATDIPHTMDVKRLGFLFEHELAHCAGYPHSQMGPLNHWKLATSGRYDYLDGLSIRPKVAKAPKPKPDVQVLRYQAAAERLARWSTKLKRAETGVRKARAQVRRYEKVLAADGRLAALKGKA